MIVFNDSVDSRILEKYPIVSREVSFLQKNLMYDLCVAMSLGFVEATMVFYLVYRFVANDYDTVGYQSSVELESMLITIILLVNHKIRVFLHYTKWNLKSILVNCITLATSSGYIIARFSHPQEDIVNETVY